MTSGRHSENKKVDTTLNEGRLCKFRKLQRNMLVAHCQQDPF